MTKDNFKYYQDTHPHLRHATQEIVEQLKPFPEDLHQALQIFQQA